MPWSGESAEPAEHGDPHDPRFDLDRQDNIVLLALGETVDPAFEAHRTTCTQCQAEVAAYSQTVGLARESTEHREDLDSLPPPAVWAGIAAELGMGRTSIAGVPSTVGALASSPRHRRHRVRWRSAMLVAAAVVILAAGVGAGIVVGRQHSSTPATRADAQLGQMAGGPTGVSGTAVVHASGRGEQLIVATRNLPLRQGYYQVWLFSPAANNMIPVGALAADGTGTFPVPANVDLRSYDVVDVSAQDFGGTDTVVHKQSVLRGGLTQ